MLPFLRKPAATVFFIFFWCSASGEQFLYFAGIPQIFSQLRSLNASRGLLDAGAKIIYNIMIYNCL